MCGYKDQTSLQFDKDKFIFRQNTLDLPERLANAQWLDVINVDIKAVDVPNVGGIGDHFVIHYMDNDGEFLKHWSRFGMELPLYPGKNLTYFNSKIETIEKYHQDSAEGTLKKFGIIVLQMFMQQPCVVFVDRFFEADKEWNTGYYKIERKDGGYIPLAGFHGAAYYEDPVSRSGYCLVTRDPYPSIQGIGHHRSPVILRDDKIETWLNQEASFQDKLDCISAEDDHQYIFELVDKAMVTKRREAARIPITDGIRREGTLSEAK